MNKTWMVKELSGLTKISVRTLHHYDSIGLLTPAVRRDNGYRVYSKDDLVRLQQIVALKYLGFPLDKIGEMLRDGELTHHLAMQQALLREKRSEIDMVLKMIAESLAADSVDTDEVLALIVGYKTGIDAAKNWQDAYTQEELDAFQEVGAQYSTQERADYQLKWQRLMERVQEQMQADPSANAPESIMLAREWHELFERVYKQHPEIKHALQRVHTQGQIPDELVHKSLMGWIGLAKKAAGIE